MQHMVDLAKVFELRATRILKNSLTKKADMELSNPALLGAINYYLQKNIGPDDFNKWLLKNQQILGPTVRDNEWYESTHGVQTENNNLLYRIYVYKDKDRADREMKVKQSAILYSEGKVPQLYINIGIKADERASNLNYDNASIDNPDLAHDTYIVQAMGRLMGVKNPITIRNFIEQNKAKLEELKKLFQETPKYLGGGADGVAFSIAPNKVLKLFRSELAFRKSQEAMTRVHKHPELSKTEAMIYDVGILNKDPDHEMYYYIIEKMKPSRSLGQSVIDALDDIVINIKDKAISFNEDDFFDNRGNSFSKRIDDPTQHAAIKEELIPEIQFLTEQMKEKYPSAIKIINSSVEGLNQNWLPLLVEEILLKIFSNRTDLHLGNLGLTPYGQFRYFDPVYD